MISDANGMSKRCSTHSTAKMRVVSTMTLANWSTSRSERVLLLATGSLSLFFALIKAALTESNVMHVSCSLYFGLIDRENSMTTSEIARFKVDLFMNYVLVTIVRRGILRQPGNDKSAWSIINGQFLAIEWIPSRRRWSGGVVPHRPVPFRISWRMRSLRIAESCS